MDQRRSLLDALPDDSHPWGMPKSNDLTAVDVHTEDVGDYNVTESGWYAVDDAGEVVLGPFDSLKQCERAIADRKRMLGPKT
jgi:hypothetical protein